MQIRFQSNCSLISVLPISTLCSMGGIILGMVSDRHGWTLVLNSEYEWVLLFFVASGGNGWNCFIGGQWWEWVNFNGDQWVELLFLVVNICRWTMNGASFTISQLVVVKFLTFDTSTLLFFHFEKQIFVHCSFAFGFWFITTKCECNSLVPVHQTSEFTHNPVKSLNIQGHLCCSGFYLLCYFLKVLASIVDFLYVFIIYEVLKLLVPLNKHFQLL